MALTDERVPFTPIDEAVHLLDTPAEPWSIQLEVRVAGALDEARLRAAVPAALARHPMARARLLPARRTDKRWTWAITGVPDLDPLKVVDCPDDLALSEVRSELHSLSVPLAESPPLRLRLARHPLGDVVMVNANHAAFDGFGTLHVLRSIAKAYIDEEEPGSDVGLGQARDVEGLTRADGAVDRARRLWALADKARDLAAPPARLAPQGASDRPGYGIHLVSLPRPESPPDVTVNDVLLAALNLAIAGWNVEQGTACRRIGVLMPVNLRPPEWKTEVVTNFVSESRVSTTSADRRTPQPRAALVRPGRGRRRRPVVLGAGPHALRPVARRGERGGRPAPVLPVPLPALGPGGGRRLRRPLRHRARRARTRGRLMAWYGYLRPLEVAQAEPPLPPPLPPGRMVDVPKRGEMFVRDVAATGETGGPTILLLHGWTLCADLNWFALYAALARHGRVLAMDVRGHGRGLRSEQRFTLEAAADDAAALLAHLGLAPAIVVGYSMGGSIGMLMWRRHPATVAGLVLQSTALQWRTVSGSFCGIRSSSRRRNPLRSSKRRSDDIERQRRRCHKRPRTDAAARQKWQQPATLGRTVTV